MLDSVITSVHRRTFLRRGVLGIGALALSEQLRTRVSGASPTVTPQPHFPPKAKRVIFLCMAGGPSQLETFDYKPVLAQRHGEPMPDSLTAGQPIAQLQGQVLRCFGPQYDFRQYGQSGQYVSSAFPHMAKLVDRIAVIRSMTTKQINHDPAHTFVNCGTQLSGRPCMGSWVLYGLGSEAQDLPGFVVLTSVGGGQSQPIASRQWHSGFLPSKYQGVHFHSKGDPVLYINNPPGVQDSQQRRVIDAVNELNELRNRRAYDPEIATAISQFEMAFRMQASVPELVDLSGEPQHVLDMYGAQPGDGSFASNCLLARRMAERGVRFIQLYHRGWDHHNALKRGIETVSSLVDKASWALVEDLKQRGMLEDTLVVWGGEFGRTPMSQGDQGELGRDHHIKGFSIWMAGGGVKPGISYGSTDDFGYHVAENEVTVHDFHATMLQLLGLDHQRLTHKFQGLDMRLTGVEPSKVVKQLLI